jgi:hypothetical protein
MHFGVGDGRFDRVGVKLVIESGSVYEVFEAL